MYLTGLIYFLAIALIISAIFSFGFRRRGPWGRFWVFFIILFLAIWASDIWLPPTGPYWGGIHWFPPLAVGILLALILAAATPPEMRENERPERASGSAPPNPEPPGYVALGVFFWIFLIILIVGVIIGLFNHV